MTGMVEMNAFFDIDVISYEYKRFSDQHMTPCSVYCALNPTVAHRRRAFL